MGVRPGVDLEELLALIDTGLRAIAAPPTAVLALATVTLRADEPALLAAARHHGWPLLAYPPELLATVPVPHPGRASLTALGTAGVAEAACLLTPGPHRATRSGPPADPHPADVHPAAALPRVASLVLPKRTSPRATLAIARHPPPAHGAGQGPPERA